MKPDQIAQHVRAFHDRVSEAEAVLADLADILMMPPETRLSSAVWELVGGYKDVLDSACHIGIWLEWWWLECGLGATPLKAGPAGGELRTIATIDDLVQLVLEDIAASEKEDTCQPS